MENTEPIDDPSPETMLPPHQPLSTKDEFGDLYNISRENLSSVQYILLLITFI